jgi:hypothetical protein
MTRGNGVDTPDRWLVVTIITPEGPLDKVLMGWWGGYLGSDSWRLNSGVTEVLDEGDAFVFVGLSGSQYRCYKAAYGTTRMTSHVLHDWLQRAEPNTVIVRDRYPYTA